MPFQLRGYVGLNLNWNTFYSEGGTINAVISGLHWADCLKQAVVFSYAPFSLRS